jgi:cell division initiation protein
MESMRRAFRGYEPAQVDKALADLNSEIAQRQREIEELRGQNARLQHDCRAAQDRAEALATNETAVRDALVSAHRHSEQILADARREAEILLQVAREASARLQEDLRGRIDDLNWQIERLALQKQKFQNDLRDLLEGNLALLQEQDQPAATVNQGRYEPDPNKSPEGFSVPVEPEEATS